MISPYKTGVPASIFPWPPIHSYPFSPVTRPRPGELALPSEGLQVLSGAKVGGVMWAALMSGSVGHLSPAGSVQKSNMYDDVHGLSWIYIQNYQGEYGILWLYNLYLFNPPLMYLYRMSLWSFMECSFGYHSINPDLGGIDRTGWNKQVHEPSLLIL